MKENLKRGRNMDVRPLYTFATNDQVTTDSGEKMRNKIESKI